MIDILGRTEFEEARRYVQEHTSHAPLIGIVLGSGFGGLSNSIEQADIIPYSDIPHWPQSTVLGHSGQLYIGVLEGKSVLVMAGRIHYYEGYDFPSVTLPIRVMQLLGIKVVILTNAVGGINKSFKASDLMLISDHINLVGMTGANPLRGPNDNTLGLRFPDMSRVYDRELRVLAKTVALETDITLHEGVFTCIAGPSFETPAEIRFLRALGADAVGMSTAPEAIVARHGNMRVLGISGISNTVIDNIESTTETSHEEVLQAGKVIVPRLETLIRGVVRQLTL
jgi:purine-nucleoside phosphorylase